MGPGDRRRVAAQTLTSGVDGDALEASALAVRAVASARHAARALDQVQLCDAEGRCGAHHLLGLVALAQRLHEHDARALDTRRCARHPERALQCRVRAVSERCVGFELSFRVEGNEGFARAQTEYVAEVMRRLWIELVIARL